MSFRVILLVIGIGLVVISGCVRERPIPVDNFIGGGGRNQSNVSQGYVPDTSTGKGLCDQACIDFCQTHPNTPGPPWDKIIPPGSTKNCKTILEEELDIPDLSTCRECKCICPVEEGLI